MLKFARMDDHKNILPSPLVFKLGYIMLPYSLTIDPEIEISGEKFFTKESFHISILSVQKYAFQLSQKAGVTLNQAEEEIVNLVVDFVKSNPLSFDHFLDDFRIAQEDDKKTIVVMCKVKGIEELYDYLRDVLKLDIPLQPTHITLYNLANKKRVGLTSRDEVEKLTIPLKGDELKKIKQAVRFLALQGETLRG